MRPTWHRYFLDIAKTVAARATCPRKSVGCVIVSGDHRILCSGYNGSPPNMPHCTDVGCDMVDGHCVRSNHAETNAIAQAARHGISIQGAEIYLTTFPCWNCFRQLLAAGISAVYFEDEYRLDPRVFRAAELSSVRLFQIKNDIVMRLDGLVSVDQIQGLSEP